MTSCLVLEGSMMKRLSIVLCCALLSCTSTAKPVRFSEAWPTELKAYDQATDAWTRRALIRASAKDYGSQLLEVYATFLSTQWRAAFVQRQSELQHLSEASREKLKAGQQQEAAQSHQLKLLISTYHPEHNELHREASIWRVVLVDESGAETEAKSIEKDRRPRQLIAAEFSKFDDFAEAYLVTFPKTKILDGQKFSLRISSSLGAAEMLWQRQ